MQRYSELVPLFDDRKVSNQGYGRRMRLPGEGHVAAGQAQATHCGDGDQE